MCAMKDQILIGRVTMQMYLYDRFHKLRGWLNTPLYLIVVGGHRCIFHFRFGTIGHAQYTFKPIHNI